MTSHTAGCARVSINSHASGCALPRLCLHGTGPQPNTRILNNPNRGGAPPPRSPLVPRLRARQCVADDAVSPLFSVLQIRFTVRVRYSRRVSSARGTHPAIVFGYMVNGIWSTVSLGGRRTVRGWCSCRKAMRANPQQVPVLGIVLL
jgi:hypothetical protein